MTADIAPLVSDNLDVWTAAIERKAGVGRSGSRKLSLYGIGRLRALVLDLAVRGKLVPQNAVDEPASKLLETIRSEKPGYLREHSLPKQRALGSIEQTPFDVPPTWSWTRLGDIAVYIQRGKSPKYEIGSGVMVVSQRCVQWTGLDLSAAKEISRASLNSYEPYRFLQSGDLLWNSTGTGTIGRVIAVNAVPENLVCDSHVTVVRCPWANPRYLQYWLASDAVYGQIEVLAAGSTNQIEWTAQLATSQAVPLPPLAEQQRIVAKVDELMVLCDTLEEESKAAMAAHQTLVETFVATLTASADAAELATNWQRLETHFDTLFTTEPSVDALKTTVLDLAARGKLTVQNKADGSAAESLQGIDAEKRNLEMTGTLRKEKPLPDVSHKEIPFLLPDGWLWVRIGRLALFTQYGTSQKAEKLGAGIPVLAMGNINSGKVDINSDKCIPEDSEELPELFLEPGDLLYNRTNSYELVGKTGLFNGPPKSVTFASYLIRIRLAEAFASPKYVNWIMNSRYFRETQVVPKITKQTGQANVSGGAMRNMLIPLPPLSEQHRIVTKVDELMALCDALKSRIADAATTQIHLADAIIDRAAA